MNYVGDYNPGQIVYIYFNTFDSNDPSASVTITNFVDTDVHIHKDDGLTQRNNTAGVAIDVDVDAITGTHFISIDTSDNTVDDFFVAGHDYFVRIEGTTVDAATVNAVVGSFSLANRAVAGWMASSDIATLASQTSFTLGQGSADDDAYNNCTIVISDQATTIQKCVGRISDYTGSTKTVTLAADPGIFTMAAGDNVQIFASSALANVDSWLGTLATSGTGGPDVNVNAISDDATAAATLELFVEALDQADGQIDAGTFNAGAIDAAAIATDAIGAAEIAADAIGASEIATDAIGAAEIAANAIGASELATDAIGDAQIATGAIASTAFAAGAIDAAAIATDAIGAAEIAADAIGASEIATDAIGAAELAADAVDEIWDEAISGHTTLGTVGQVINALAARTGEVNDAAAAAGDFDVDGFTEATDDHFNGMVMIMTSGANLGQARIISDYVGTGQNCVFDRAWTAAPADNDDFVILGPLTGVLTELLSVQADGMVSADVREWLGTAVTLSGNSFPDVNVNEISDDTTAAATLELFVEVLDQADGQIDAGTFDAGAIDAAAIATDAIGAAEIATDAIGAAEIATDAIGASELATDAIGSAELAATAVEEITRAVNPQINTAFSNITFEMYDDTNHNPSTGLTVTGEVSLDAGAYAGVSGTIAEISDGTYQFDAASGDMNGALVVFRFSSANTDDTFVHVKTAA